MQKSLTFKEIKQKLVDYCVYQDRCHAEVEQKMKDFLLIPEAKEEILLYLMKENFLNEERFVRSYIRGKFYIKKWGRNKIKIQLFQKKISEKLILRCFDEIDEEDYQRVCRDIFQKYNQQQKNLKLYQKKMKSIKYLLSRGFEYEIILKIIDSLEEES